MAYTQGTGRSPSGSRFRGMGLIGNLQVSKGVVTGGIVLGLAATVTALLIPVELFGEARRIVATDRVGALPPGFSDDSLGVQDTPFGPLTAVDRDFVRRVRLAGLWEGPAGDRARTAGTSAAVRTAGDHMVTGHRTLDAVDLAAAQVLKIADMPREPSPEQRGWLDEINGASPKDFDETFVRLTRAAHGKVFQVLALTRATTQNTQVRKLADEADRTVRDHMDVLERTGLWKGEEQSK
ncbi:DUF4142 domain-containing protein [Kitasatospora sp. NPDC089913]|uniref:DUF4142 domain-containing protein n=1 Tax=Streptomycetaceae TaxID=2062 RepID=UPI00087D3767|nr:DUF4142 domain-containing protein [Streptomyces sp. TLI_053]SDT82971.1 Predicted outer membrane protein [Streptomyces sp. TLI_053]